jgi:hypothetical protein
MKINNEKIFKSKISKWIAGLYFATLVFLVIMLIGIPLIAPMTFFEKSVFVIIFFVIILIIAFITFKAYKLSFIISTDSFIINGILKKHNIIFSDIKEIKKIPIPFGFRLFGASFLGGKYYFPGIGKASVAMSNFDDGVLITTKKENNFIITPKNPLRFIDDLKKEIK